MISTRALRLFAGSGVKPLSILGGWMRMRPWIALWLLPISIGGYPWLHDLVLKVEITPPERGYRVAVRAGCFACHGPNGTGGVKNPGSRDGEVPGFAGGTPMMWVKSESELREYILDGAPERSGMKRKGSRSLRDVDDECSSDLSAAHAVGIGFVDFRSIDTRPRVVRNLATGLGSEFLERLLAGARAVGEDPRGI